MPRSLLDPRRGLFDDDSDIAPPEEEDASTPALDASSPAPSTSSRPAYDTSRGDPLQYRGAMREWFKDEVHGAANAQHQQDVFDLAESRRQSILSDRAARKAEADRKEAEKQSGKDLNSAQEADFRQRGVSHFTDANGNIVPDRNEDNTIRFTPKTGETKYDDQTGDAYKENRDDHGVTSRDELDANAPIGTHPTRMGELYRQDKNSGWNYLGTVDEGLQSSEPSVREAAIQARDRIDKHLHGAAQRGFTAAENDVSAQERQANLDYQSGVKQQQALESQAASLQSAANETTGGMFGIGAKATPAAEAAKQQLADLKAKMTSLPTAPDPKAFKEQRRAVKVGSEAFQASVAKNGFDAAEAELRKRVTDQGGDPDSDPILREISKARADAGLLADGSKKKPADDPALRAHPVFGPLLTQRDTLDFENARGNDEVKRVADEHDAKLAPLQSQLQQGQAQLDELSQQAEMHRQQLVKATGLDLKPGEDIGQKLVKATGLDLKPGEDIGQKLGSLSPANFAKASPILQSLSPVLAEANRLSQSLAPVAEQLRAGIDERNQAVQDKQDETYLASYEKHNALNDKWKAATEQERMQKLPEAAKAAVALARQIPKMSGGKGQFSATTGGDTELTGSERKNAEDLQQQLEGNFAGTDFDDQKLKEEAKWQTAEKLADAQTSLARAADLQKRGGLTDAAAGMGGIGGIGAFGMSGEMDRREAVKKAELDGLSKSVADVTAKLPADERQDILRKASTVRVERAMAMAEQKLGAADKLKDWAENPDQFVGFVRSAPEIGSIADAAAAAYRIQDATKKGEEPSGDDQALVATFAAKASQKSDWWYKALDMLGAQPAFWQEFAATGGAYGAGKAVAEKAGMAVLKKLVGEGAGKMLARTAEDSALKILGKGAASLAGKGLVSMAGSLPQTALAGAPTIAHDIIERMAPKVGWTPNEAGELKATVEKGQGAFRAALGSFGDEYNQIFTEHAGEALGMMGEMIGGAAGKLFPKLTAAAREAVAHVAVVQKWLSSRAGATVGDFASALKKGGYHGVLGEMFEERVGNVAQAIGDTAGKVGFDHQKFADALRSSINENMPTLEQLGLEAATFGVPGLVSHVSNIRAENRALDDFHGQQKQWLDHAEAIRQLTPSDAAVSALSHAPSDSARELGATGTDGLGDRLQELDHRIGDLRTQLDAAGQSTGGLGGVDRQGRNQVAEELANAHAERQDLISSAVRSQDLAAASDEIDKLAPEHPALAGATPESIENTKKAARAMVKIANGVPLEALTSDEKAALDSPRPDGSKIPRVEMVKGQPVLTQGAIDALKTLSPTAGNLIRESEAERRQSILAEAQSPTPKATTTKGGEKNGQKQTTDEKGQGREGLLNPAGAEGKPSALGPLPVRELNAAEKMRQTVLATGLRNDGVSRELADRFAQGWVSKTGATAPIAEHRAAMMQEFQARGGALKTESNADARNQQLHQTLLAEDAGPATPREEATLPTFEVQVDGEPEPRTVQAKDEAAAKAMVAADPSVKSFVRDAVMVAHGEQEKPSPAPKPATTPASPEEEAFFQRAKADVERDAGSKLPAKVEGALREAAKKVRPAVERWKGAFSSVGWKLSTDAPNAGMGVAPGGKLVFSLAHILKEREGYARGFAEHGVTEEAIHAVSEKLHTEGKIDLDAIWAEAPEAIRQAVREAYKTGNDYQHGREFWRMLIQGTLNLGPEGWNIDGKPIVTEQVNPTFLATIRDALAKLFQAFSDMRKALRDAGATAEYIDEVDRARDLTLDRIKEIDAFGKKSVDPDAADRSVKEHGPDSPAASPLPDRAPAPEPSAEPVPNEPEGGRGVQGEPVGGVRPPDAGGRVDRGDAGERRDLGDSVEWSGERVALAGEWRSKNPRGAEVFKGKWAFVPLKLLSTNTQHGAAQDRIDREKTGAAQRLEIIGNVTPDTVALAWGASPSLNDGAPIVTPEGSVEVGNNRTLALRDMFATHPDKAALYEQWARAEAARLGLDGQAHAGEPVALVRVDDGTRGGLSQKEFVAASNTGAVETRSLAETALADRSMFTNSGLLDSLEPNEDGSFNAEFLNAFYRAAGSPKELRFEDGSPDNGKIERRAQAALLAHLLGDHPGVDRVLTSLMDNLATPGIRQVVSALAKSGPALLNAEAVNPALSITPNVGRALTALLDYRRAKEAGEVRSVDDYRGQRSLFAGDERLPEPLDAKILNLFAEARSVKAVSDRFLRYAKAVQDYGHPDQGRFFSEEPPNPDQYLGTQPQTNSEQEMLWDISERDQPAPVKDNGSANQWAAVYRKLFAIEKAGQSLTVGQRALMDRAEQALGQRLLFGDEVRGTKPMEQYREQLRLEQEDARQSEQPTLFAQAQNREKLTAADAQERFDNFDEEDPSTWPKDLAEKAEGFDVDDPATWPGEHKVDRSPVEPGDWDTWQGWATPEEDRWMDENIQPVGDGFNLEFHDKTGRYIDDYNGDQPVDPSDPESAAGAERAQRLNAIMQRVKAEYARREKAAQAEYDRLQAEAVKRHADLEKQLDKSSFLFAQPQTAPPASLRSIDPAGDADYSGDREQYRRNLGRAIESAQNHLGRVGSSGNSQRDDAEATQAGVAAGAIRELDFPRLKQSIESGSLGKNLGRNEHDVFIDKDADRVIKITKGEGQFGAVGVGNTGRMVEYLRRLEVLNRELDDDLRFEGVLRNPDTGKYRIVVSQPFIKGTNATKEQIAAYFKSKGYEKFSDRSWWHGGHEVLMNDAEPHNILMGEDGKVYPIDIIPQWDLSPRRIQQIEMQVEGWKNQELHTQPQTDAVAARGLDLFNRLTPQQQATAVDLANKLSTHADEQAAVAHPEPTPAQKEAGNYRMGHTRIGGLDITIENAAGSVRSGQDKTGKPWSNLMGTHYGYVKRTEGKDGDHVDVMIKAGTPEDWSGTVYVVNQQNAAGGFDEHKAVLGAASEDEARALYLSNYSKGWKAGPIAAMPMPEFSEWLKTGDTTKLARTSSAWISEGSPSALVTQNLARADAIAARFNNIPGVEAADVQQVARVGLFKAARSYDPASGLDFGPYAITAINNDLRSLYQKRTNDRNDPTLDAPISLRDEASEPGETGQTRLADPAANVERDAARTDAAHLLDSLIAELPENLRSVMQGLRAGMTQQEIGEARDRSKQAVNNLSKIALARLRKKLQERGLHVADDVILSAQPQTESSPIDEIMAMLDGDELDPLSEKAAAEEPGSFVTGRPDLALGARSPDVRAVDEWMKAEFTPETREQWRDEAEWMLHENYQGTVSRLALRASSGDALNPAEIVAAQLILDRELAKPQTPDRARNVQALTLANRLVRRVAGRSLAACVDTDQPPETRRRLFLNQTVNGTRPQLVKQIAEASTSEEKQRLLDKARRESDLVKEELRKQGISIDDILAGEVVLRLKGAPIVQNIVKSFDEKRQAAFKLLQGGMKTFEEVAKEVKLSPKEVEAVRDAFVAEFRKKHFEKFAKGATAEQLDSPALFAQAQEGGGVSAEQAEAEFQRALRMMGIVPKEDQGKFKVVKRRTRPRKTSAPPFTGQIPSDRPVGEIPSRQGDLLKPGRNVDRAPTGISRFGDPTNKQGDLLNPERNADRAPLGTPVGEVPNRQNDLLHPERNADRAPLPTPVGEIGGKQTKLELPFEEWMYRHELDDPVQVVRIAGIASAANGNMFDMAQEFWINNILSGPATQSSNFLGNLVSTAWDFSVQRGMEAMVNQVYRDADSAQLGEFQHILRGVLPGLTKGISLAAKCWNAESDLFKSAVLDQQVEMFEDYEKGGGVKPAIGGKTGRVIRMPGRALLFMDALFKRTIGEMEARAQAYRIAKKEGLKGSALEGRIRELANTPGSEAWIRAVDKAVDLTFQKQSFVGQLFGNIKAKTQDENIGNRIGARIVSFLFPFINTPWNIFKTGVRKTPLGAANVAARVIHAGVLRIKDGKAFATSYPASEQIKHISEQILGWAAMAALWALSEGDPDDDKKDWLVTGSQPLTETTAGERALGQRAFGGPYQMRIGGRKGITINYGRYEPFATVIGTTVDMIRSLKRKVPTPEKLDALFSFFTAQAQAKTFLQSQSEMLKTLQDGKGVSDFAKKTFLQALVPNIIRQPLRNLDEWVRDAKGAGTGYQIVPLGSLAEKKLDVYGAPVEKAGNPLSRLFFAAGTVPSPNLAAADQLLLHWNSANPTEKWAPSPPDRHYKKGAKTVEMTGAEYEKYTTLVGKKVTAGLAGKLRPSQIETPTEADVKTIRAVFEKAHTEAKEALFPKQGGIDARTALWR